MTECYPRITIVTPSYNQAKYLPEAIESILGQDYPNLEYIIVDGGSTDGSVDIIKRYESQLAFWVSEKDSGQSEAINKGLRRATGQLFNWINSDDVLFPGALQRVAEAYAKHPQADMIVGCRARSGADGKIFKVSAPPSAFAMSPERWSMFICQQSVFVTLKVMTQLGGVREDLHCIMDAELYYRLLKRNPRYVRIGALLALIREHPDAKGLARSHEWAPETQRIWSEYGIEPRRVKVAQAKTRLCRLLDGSYVKSFIMQEKWRGRRPWEAAHARSGRDL